LYLDRVIIKNFRSIKKMELDLKRNLNILIGINEAGKSNILRAISMLTDQIKPNKNDRRDMLVDELFDDESYIRFIFKKESEDFEQIKKNMSNFFINNGNQKIFIDKNENELTFDEFNNSQTEVLFTVDLDECTNYKSNWIIEDLSFNDSIYRLDENQNKIIKYNNKNFKLSEYKYIIQNNDQKLDNISARQVSTEEFIQDFYMINKQVLDEKFPECIFWTYNNNKNNIPSKVKVNTFLENNENCIPLKNMFNLSGFTDITTIVSQAKTKQNGIANLLRNISKKTTDYIHSVWSEQSHLNISITENGDSFDINIQDTENIYDFSRRSDGFKRFVSFLLLVGAQNQSNDITGTYILIDEPDIGLHPESSKKLRDELIKISKNNFVYYSTHSIFMINKNDIDSHLVIRKTNEITSIADLQNSDIYEEELLYNALGYSVFETIKNKNIIFEGWRDKRLYNLFVEDEIDITNQISSCHSQGVKDIQRVVSMLQLANKEYIIVSDSDKPAMDAKKRFKEKEKWFLYNDLIENGNFETCEDFINYDINIKIFNDLCRKENIKEIENNEENNNSILSIFDSHLSSIGFDKTKRKQQLNTFKELLFKNVKKTDVKQEYSELISSIKTIL